MTKIEKFIENWKSHSERTQGDLTDEFTRKVLAKVDEVDKIIESWVRTYGIQEQIQVQRDETRQGLGSIASQFRKLQDSFSQLQTQSQAQSNRLSKAAAHFEQQKKQA